jgi:Fc receptor-like protein
MNQVVCLMCSTDFLVLQAPPAVFEGDSVVLRCYAKKGIEAETLTFYKDGKALTLHPQSSEFYIHRANLKDNGQYKCTSKKKWSFGSLYTSNTVVVQVQGRALIILNRLVRDRLSVVVEVE